MVTKCQMSAWQTVCQQIVQQVPVEVSRQLRLDRASALRQAPPDQTAHNTLLLHTLI